jgi:phosphatidylglycerophosphate synthase
MSAETEGSILVLEAPADPGLDLDTKVLGLTLPLRLALTAQAAGARAIVVSDAARALGVDARLTDARLTIPVVGEAERGPPERATRLPANLAVHRSELDRRRGPRPFGYFEPIAVTDAASRRRAERALLRSLRKPQDGWTSTYLNRHLSLFLTRWLVGTPLRPNQVSPAILAVGLLGGWLASRGTYGSMLVGAALFQTQSVLDGCDGEMSRITFRGSRLGEWLDTVGDDLTNYGFFAGAAWGLYASSGAPVYLVLGAVTVASGVVTSAIEYRYLASIGSGDLLKYPLGIGKAPGGGAATSPAGKIADAVSPLFKRDTFALLTLIGAALGQLGAFLAAFSVGGVGILATVVAAEVRRARAARRIGG